VSRRDCAGSQLCEDIRLAYALMVFGVVLSLGTVAVWGVTQTLVLFVFGSGIWMLGYDYEDRADWISDEEYDASWS
ncbi:MAG: hypothetical protein AAF989_09335, partial [Planctomycetota bacterium]